MTPGELGLGVGGVRGRAGTDRQVGCGGRRPPFFLGWGAGVWVECNSRTLPNVADDMGIVTAATPRGPAKSQRWNSWRTANAEIERVGRWRDAFVRPPVWLRSRQETGINTLAGSD